MVRIALFGSTGSIGRKVLDVVRLFSDKFSVVALGVRKSFDDAITQIEEFKPKYLYLDSYVNLYREVNCKIVSGVEGVREITSDKDVDVVIVAVDGYFGVFPTIEAIKNRKKVLTANKESIFMWGYEIMELSKEFGVEVIPLDSEHNTIFNLLNKVGYNNFERVIITASGGPFLNKDVSELDSISVSDVMSHPNWKMGKVVTFNSATMFNKFLEVFEAHIFFGISIDKIEVVVHPESRIHSMILLKDGSIWAVYYKPDMIFPIANAMFYPEVPNLIYRNVDYELPINKNLEFRSLDLSKFKIMSIIKDLENSDRRKRVGLNLVNEECIKLFEEGRLKFTKIQDILIESFRSLSLDFDFSISDELKHQIEEARKYARDFVLKYI